MSLTADDDDDEDEDGLLKKVSMFFCHSGVGLTTTGFIPVDIFWFLPWSCWPLMNIQCIYRATTDSMIMKIIIIIRI